MKQRIIGRINGDNYEVVSPAGDVMKAIPLDEATNHSKLAAAIKRNRWEEM